MIFSKKDNNILLKKNKIIFPLVFSLAIMFAVFFQSTVRADILEGATVKSVHDVDIQDMNYTSVTFDYYLPDKENVNRFSLYLRDAATGIFYQTSCSPAIDTLISAEESKYFKTVNLPYGVYDIYLQAFGSSGIDSGEYHTFCFPNSFHAINTQALDGFELIVGQDEFLFFERKREMLGAKKYFEQRFESVLSEASFMELPYSVEWLDREGYFNWFEEILNGTYVPETSDFKELWEEKKSAVKKTVADVKFKYEEDYEKFLEKRNKSLEERGLQPVPNNESPFEKYKSLLNLKKEELDDIKDGLIAFPEKDEGESIDSNEQDSTDDKKNQDDNDNSLNNGEEVTTSDSEEVSKNGTNKDKKGFPFNAKMSFLVFVAVIISIIFIRKVLKARNR